MAIGPNELERAFEPILTELEKEIDKQLLNATLKSGFANTINVYPPRDMRSNHLDKLRKKYLEVGWHQINWHNDQREGTWISFEYRGK